MRKKRVPRQKVTLGRSFQIVKENLAESTGSARPFDIAIGATFTAVWWWIIGVPQDEIPPGE